MKIYFLDQPLTDEESKSIIDLMELQESIEQVRVPYVLPIVSRRNDYSKELSRHENILRKHLLNVGISKDKGTQIGFVAPVNMHWYSVITNAIFKETGSYPYLIQTQSQREAIGNPGDLRILDGEGLMGL